MKSVNNNMINGVHQLLLIYCVITSSYVWFQLFQNDNNQANKNNNTQYGRNLLQADEETNDIAVGSILIWGDTIDEIPDGWELCNGENNTPNLTDRFIIGSGNAYNVDETGGNFEIKLGINQLPSHNHKLQNESILIEESEDEHYHQLFNEDITISFDTGHTHQITTNNISFSGKHSHTSNYNLSTDGEHTHKVVKIEKRFFNFNPTNTPTHNPSIEPTPTSNPSITPTNIPSVEISPSNTDNPTTNINTADYSIDFELETLSINNGLSIASVGNHIHSACSMSTNAAGNHQHVTINLGGAGLSDVKGLHAHSVSGHTCNAGAHSHTINGNLNLDLSDVYTTHKGEHFHNLNGNSSVDGMHSHELYAISDVNGQHNHIVYGQTDYSADNHTHEVIFGETEIVGENHKINIINPYYSLAYIRKTYTSRSDVSIRTSSGIKDSSLSSISNAAIILSVLAVVFVIIIGCVLAFLMYKSYKNENENEYAAADVNEIGEQENIENESSSSEKEFKVKKEMCGVQHAADIELQAINTCDIGEVIERIDDNSIDNIQNNIQNDGIDTSNIENIFA